MGGVGGAVGFALDRYSYSDVLDDRALDAVSAALGALVALIGLWLWLMRPRGVEIGHEE